MTFIIQKSAKSSPLVVHVDQLKLCEGETPRSWLLPDFDMTAIDMTDLQNENTDARKQPTVTSDADVVVTGPNATYPGSSVTDGHTQTGQLGPAGHQHERGIMSACPLLPNRCADEAKQNTEAAPRTWNVCPTFLPGPHPSRPLNSAHVGGLRDLYCMMF